MWKWPVLGVVVVLIAIGAASAADTESQLENVRGCLEDAGLQAERTDMEERLGRRSVGSIPALRVSRADERVAIVAFFSDDFEAEKARPEGEEGLAWEQVDNVLVLKGAAEPEGIAAVRGCIRDALAA